MMQCEDPHIMESRYSCEDAISQIDSIFTEPDEEQVGQIELIRTFLDKIPPREADFVELYFFKRLRQTTIAEMFKVSQPTICYRLRRAARRLQFLISIPPGITAETIRGRLDGMLKDPLDAEIMALMFETTCQSEVAERLNCSQGMVRHRFIRSLGMISGIPGLEDLVKMFMAIAGNLNVLREVKRFQREEMVYVVD